MIEQVETKTYGFTDSILFKAGIIAIIILALMIPSSWIQDLVTEREGYQQQQIAGISAQWSGSQLIQGPVLLLPYKVPGSPNKTGPATENIKTIYVLPQNLFIKADVKTEPFEKGVYNATVYSSAITLKGDFEQPDLASLGINADDVLFDKAKLIFGLSDMKGLKSNPAVKIAGHDYVTEPALRGNTPFDKGMQVNFAMPREHSFSFSYNLDVKGSNNLNFMHLGKTTDVELNSDWKSPVFEGSALPDSRTVNSQGFKANWHMVFYNRPFPQQWLNNNALLNSLTLQPQAVFGVKLQVPIDQYRKITRTVKYATLIILLSFVSLFLTELIRKKRIHVFNYTLIGAAMVVYYTLLLSLSEQIGYNYAYLVSSIATILLIAIFTASLLKNNGAAALFAFILSVFYGFIFILIQLEDLSLLVGSIALFLVVAALMYFSRKINWDKH